MPESASSRTNADDNDDNQVRAVGASDDAALSRLAGEAGQVLNDRGLRLASAESCTGGWIAKLATDIPGSSAWFERGFVTYSNAAKEQLGVDARVIAQHGAVSAETVAAMVSALIEHRNGAAEAALAVSGIAGPGGGSEAKPVGTVWLAWSLAGAITTRCYHFAGNRDAVRRAAVAAAFGGLLTLLKTSEKR